MSTWSDDSFWYTEHASTKINITETYIFSNFKYTLYGLSFHKNSNKNKPHNFWNVYYYK